MVIAKDGRCGRSAARGGGATSDAARRHPGTIRVLYDYGAGVGCGGPPRRDALRAGKGCPYSMRVEYTIIKCNSYHHHRHHVIHDDDIRLYSRCLARCLAWYNDGGVRRAARDDGAPWRMMLLRMLLLLRRRRLRLRLLLRLLLLLLLRLRLRLLLRDGGAGSRDGAARRRRAASRTMQFHSVNGSTYSVQLSPARLAVTRRRAPKQLCVQRTKDQARPLSSFASGSAFKKNTAVGSARSALHTIPPERCIQRTKDQARPLFSSASGSAFKKSTAVGRAHAARGPWAGAPWDTRPPASTDVERRPSGRGALGTRAKRRTVLHTPVHRGGCTKLCPTMLHRWAVPC